GSSNAEAALVNLTMVDGVASGYITADKCSALVAGPQKKSNGNHGVAAAVANLAVVPLDTNGSFCVYNQVAVNLVADVQGFFSAPIPQTFPGQVLVSETPDRKLDTRKAPLTKPAAGSITKVMTGVPAGATAALVNLTMVDGDGAGYITADRCSVLTAGPQTKSNGNHIANDAIANLSVVPVDADGSFCIYNQLSVNLVVDLQGYFITSDPNGLRFTLIAPARAIDTRLAPLTKPAAGTITKVMTGAPLGTTSALVNMTMVDGDGGGYITADKCSNLVAGPQSKSSGNFVANDAIANLAVVPLDADGSFCIFNQIGVNLVVDVQGYFGPTGADVFYASGQGRYIDTRRP
ncbi:MAG TPA: hypothetical protein VGM78_03170, partial [Ilumatobacteraceae bacterium]